MKLRHILEAQQFTLPIIRELFDRSWDKRATLRRVGVVLSSFSAGSGQLDLLDPDRRERLERLARTTDRLRDKFGFSKVQLASSLETHKDGT